MESLSPSEDIRDALSAPRSNDASPMHTLIDAACQEACERIAPAWPLDQAIAVNPHWSRIALPVRQVAARMAVLGGIRVFPARAHHAQAWHAGRILQCDLDFALQSLAASAGPLPDNTGDLTHLQHEAALPRLPLLIDLLDNDPQRHARLSWRQAITHQVSQTCAAYFDTHQADWRPGQSQGLYHFWRETLKLDHGIGALMGLPRIGRALNALPPTREEAEQWVLQRLGLPADVWSDYLEAVLLTVNGWASWCAYLGWQAHQRGARDEHLRELLAIRMAWGAILLECKDDLSARQAFAELQTAWHRAPAVLAQAERTLLHDELWQIALEHSYQRQLADQLSRADGVDIPHDEVAAHIYFCIDVRSEPMRRAIENVWPAVRTSGFAGFFGLPVSYAPLETALQRPQLPGLLAPSMTVGDAITPAHTDVMSAHSNAKLQQVAAQARRQRFDIATQWRAARRWPGASFSFVEAAGAGYLAKLGGFLRPAIDARARDDLACLPASLRKICRPQLLGLDDEARTSLAFKVLGAMGLTQHFAPLVLLAGHGSQSSNNAHAAALDCGACCGQTGEVNARTLAQLLNDASVRSGLAARGIQIPADTWFIAALHNTTTDEFEAFDLDLLPAALQPKWARLQTVLAHAGDQVRRERAVRLQLDPRASYADLLKHFRRRANDAAETRPEWGLAGNAAFVIAPRQRTRGLNLAGRSFLHDYDASHDQDGSLLELLMTAPMLVTHWINWQYHASTCDPEHLGSGNKLLHNVVGGHIGVFEGNGGDLRIGLARQSLHDGERWIHEPVRLSVIVDAPAPAIERIIAKHLVVRQLIENHWLHLSRFDGKRLQRYANGTWKPFTQTDEDEAR